MTDFDEIVEKRCQSIHLVLSRKAKEYATDKNRFHNFDVAARIDNTTPEKALKGMMMKHVVSVSDLINCPETVTVEMVDEKIGDLVNYLVLLEGLFLRRIDKIRKQTLSHERKINA